MDLEKRPKQPPNAPDAAPAPDTALRASDADRDRVADILREALAEGRLTAQEHSERIEGVYQAKTVAELKPFVRDLPEAAEQRPPTRAYAPAPPAEPLPQDPDDKLVAVLSSSTRKGRWRVGRRTHAYAVFGSVEIDLTEALFEHRQVVFKAYAIFGNVEVKVPENVSLRGNGSGVCGNFEVRALESDEPDAPVVIVDGYAVCGNIEARAKRGKRVRDLGAKVQQHLNKADKADKQLRKHLGH